jgi:hypothetical protein
MISKGPCHHPGMRFRAEQFEKICLRSQLDMPEFAPSKE